MYVYSQLICEDAVVFLTGLKLAEKYIYEIPVLRHMICSYSFTAYQARENTTIIKIYGSVPLSTRENEKNEWHSKSLTRPTKHIIWVAVVPFWEIGLSVSQIMHIHGHLTGALAPSTPWRTSCRPGRFIIPVIPSSCTCHDLTSTRKEICPSHQVRITMPHWYVWHMTCCTRHLASDALLPLLRRRRGWCSQRPGLMCPPTRLFTPIYMDICCVGSSVFFEFSH